MAKKKEQLTLGENQLIIKHSEKEVYFKAMISRYFRADNERANKRLATILAGSQIEVERLDIAAQQFTKVSLKKAAQTVASLTINNWPGSCSSMIIYNVFWLNPEKSFIRDISKLLLTARLLVPALTTSPRLFCFYGQTTDQKNYTKALKASGFEKVISFVNHKPRKAVLYSAPVLHS